MSSAGRPGLSAWGKFALVPGKTECRVVSAVDCKCRLQLIMVLGEQVRDPLWKSRPRHASIGEQRWRR